ncbi:protein FAR1-RELATED SEQUENCE 5-like [Asparagus officinalis]|uniref:protein FAR1-RELATED SEQUENCE 5-like n=1 Tax=Asparagus officinalis TaxID=4686 RepID=UPI00098E2983|nr:protein FAR1-RELATED SEQUENCE 5-like [Asparagus officinalis]
MESLNSGSNEQIKEPHVINASDSDFLEDGMDEVSSIPFESPGGGMYWKPRVEAEFKPYLNQSFRSLEDGIEFYREYGRKSGFEIRRHTEKKHEDGTVLLKHIVCSRAGSNESKMDVDFDDFSSSSKKRRRTVSSRCGCKAKVVFKFDGLKGYNVLSFVEEHSHFLVSGSGKQFLKSNRVLGLAHKKLVFDGAKANMGPNKTYNFAKELCGSYSNVGATCTEFKNWSRDVKLYIGDRDAQMIIEKFTDKKEMSDGFFYDYAVDEGGRLTRIFWADVIGRRNYDVFGDVISFDSTYSTNKYNMKFVPFTGLDNYKKCVVFAAGLIAKEDIDNYVWIFEVFMKCMIREPKCIVTDQCPTMKQAIPTVFTEARHRLCMWHIMKKFNQKLAKCISKMDDFKRKINALIWSIDIDPATFEVGWKDVMKEYKLESNEWLCELYNIRESWIPAYYADDPMAGLLRTTSISESENSFFDKFNRRSDTLTEFYLRYESAMEKQRHTNARLNYEGTKTMPRMDTPLLLERDAAELYTRTMFYEVQKEIMSSCYDMSINSISEEDGVKIFSIKDKKRHGKIFEVKHAYLNNDVQCTCRLFEKIGIVCRHGFFALNQADVTKIPRHLVVNRWTKGAGMRHSLQFKEISEQCNAIEVTNRKLNDIWYDFQSCVSLAGLDGERLDYLEGKLKELKHSLRESSWKSDTQNKNDVMEFFVGSKIPAEVIVKPPIEGRNKGCGRRIVGDYEKSLTQRKKKVPRLCNMCKIIDFHDAQTCPLKKTVQQSDV